MSWDSRFYNTETGEFVQLPALAPQDISFGDLEAANTGYRPDLLLPGRIYRLPDGSLHRANGATVDLLPAQRGGDGEYVEPAEMPTVRNRLSSEVWLSDPKWKCERFLPVDVSTIAQAAIDSLPDTGGTLVISDGTYYMTDVKMSGTNGTKSNVRILVVNATIRKPQHDWLKTDQARRSNVIEATYGHGHRIHALNGRVEGNKSRGGGKPPYCTKAQLGAKDSNGVPERLYRTNAIISYAKDLTSSTGMPDDRVFVVQAAGNGKEPSYTNAQEDIDKGYIVEVTHLKWNEETQTGYINAWEGDLDFAWREGVYFNGLLEKMRNAECVGLEVTDTVYGGILAGAGPLFDNCHLKGFGTYAMLVERNYVHHTGATCIGGGDKTHARIIYNVTGQTPSTGIRCDEGSHDCLLMGNVCNNEAAIGDKACMSAYKSNGVIFQGNKLSGAGIGITSAEADGQKIISNEITGCLYGMSVSKLDGGEITANKVKLCTREGIKIQSGSNQNVIGNTVLDCGGYGFYLYNNTGGTFMGNTATRSGKDGFYMEFLRNFPFIGNTACNNGALGGADSAGFAFWKGCTRITGVGNKAYDTRSTVDRTQVWGMWSDGTLVKSSLTNGELADNKNGPINLNGAVGNRLAMNDGRNLIEVNGQILLAATESAKTIYLQGGQDNPNLGVSVPSNGKPATEYLSVVGGTVNGKFGHPLIRADGVAENISVVLAGKGEGKIRFGNYTPPTAGSDIGYIPVETYDGITRYVMVKNTPA